MFAVASLWSHGHKIIWYTKISEARHVQVRFDNDLGCRIDARLLRPHTSFAWNYSQQTLSPNTPCPKISVHLYVFWITLCQKFTDFNDFWYMKSWETLISKFPILPVNCSHFTLVNSKKSFSTILLTRTLDYLRHLIIKRTVTVTMWQLECQASNVTASVQTFCTCFQSFSPLISRIVYHTLLEFSPCLNKPLPQLVRIADWLVLDKHAPTSYARCGNIPDSDHDCWLATCQDWWTRVSYSLTGSWVRCAGVLSCWKTNRSPVMLRITGSSSCISNSSR